jgi:hypothetical protein
MHIGRAIIIPAILALGVAGSVVSASAIPLAAGSAAVVQAQAATAHASPDVLYHG